MPGSRHLVLLSAGLLFGCSESAPTTPTENAPGGSAVQASTVPVLAAQSGHGPVIHHVSIGGPDNCTAWGAQPGCDANFSLSANQYADGTVDGTWVDRFSRGVGAKGAVTCLVVDGQFAWIGGAVTTPEFAGTPAIIRARDRGQAETEPTDRWGIYYNPSDLGLSENCQDEEFFPYADVPEGQVTIW